MIPIPATAKTKLINWIPKTLGGTEYDFIETQRNIPRPECPAIIAYFSSVGTRSRGNASLIRTVRNPDGSLDDFWGQWHHATLSVSLRSDDPDELAVMHEDFLRQIFRTRRDLSIRTDKVTFVDVLRSDALPMDFERESAQGEQVFMAAVDLRFEYEVSDVSDADLILRTTHDISVGEAEEPLSFSRNLTQREITCGFTAIIEDNN
jgi:hypothetical protein